MIQAQPDDATDEEIMRELAFERMIERGLDDSGQGKTAFKQRIEAPHPHMAEMR